MLFPLSEKKTLSKKNVSKLMTSTKSSNKDKETTEDNLQSSKKMNYFTPKGYTVKQQKVYSSKKNTKIEDSLLTSSSGSNFLAQSEIPKGKHNRKEY